MNDTGMNCYIFGELVASVFDKEKVELILSAQGVIVKFDDEVAVKGDIEGVLGRYEAIKYPVVFSVAPSPQPASGDTSLLPRGDTSHEGLCASPEVFEGLSARDLDTLKAAFEWLIALTCPFRLRVFICSEYDVDFEAVDSTLEGMIDDLRGQREQSSCVTPRIYQLF